MKTLTENAIQCKINITVNILLEKEEDLYTAHCLEFDIIADGKTERKAINNLINSIINHISFCISKGNLDKINNPAPKKYWKKINSIKNNQIGRKVKFPELISNKKIKSTYTPHFLKDIEFKGTEAYSYAQT